MSECLVDTIKQSDSPQNQSLVSRDKESPSKRVATPSELECEQDPQAN